MVYETWESMVQAIAKMGKLYVAGAGLMGRIYADYLTSQKIQWEGFLDKQSFDKPVCQKQVFPYAHIRGEKNACVLVSSVANKDEIVSQLKEEGIDDNKILVPATQTIALDLSNEMDGIYSIQDRIAMFRGKHAGRRCFVIGNGPSLTTNDLEKLTEEVTFASNSIYALYPYTNWRPTYYGVTDSVSIKGLTMNNNLQVVLDNCNAAFVGLMNYHSLSQLHGFSNKLFFYNNKDGTHHNRYTRFSNNACKVVFTGGTVTYVLLQLAVYMGFTSIYLLGIDFTFSVERKSDGSILQRDIINHNSLIEKEDSKYYPMLKEKVGYYYMADIDKQLACYQAAKHYADEHEIKIFNATRGGKLEIFPRVDFDSLF